MRLCRQPIALVGVGDRDQGRRPLAQASPEQLSHFFRSIAANQHTMLTSREAAAYLRITSHKLEEMAHSGDIPGFMIDGKWRFSKTVIDEWLTERQHQWKESA